MKLVVIIPTFNESENILHLVPAIQRQRAALGHDVDILVVDDESPDGTAAAVRELQQHDRALHLITGRKEGLGRAYVRGMTYALEQLGADAVIQMDADFSHDPGDLPRLLSAATNGYDFVIGSRYVEGGSVPANWSGWRRANSSYGNVAARAIAGMRSVRDCTAGFRCIRAGVLRKVGVEGIHANGYCFQIELLHKALRSGARVKEVPVHFADRTRGISKLGLPDIVEFIVAVWRIRLGDSATFVRFAVVGLTGIVVNLGLLAWLLDLGVNKYLASPLAVQASILTNVFLNNRWTFRKRRSGAAPAGRPWFTRGSWVSLGVSYGVFLILSLTTSLDPLVAQAIGIAPAVTANYLLNVYLTAKH